MRLAIAREKVTQIIEENSEATAVLDIMEIVVRNVSVDEHSLGNDNESEMTCYRKIASILDIIFKGSNITLLE